MIICFKCSIVSKAALDGLVGSGAYRDYAEAINVAIVNLEAVHREVGSDEAVVLNETALASERAAQGPKRISPSQSVLRDVGNTTRGSLIGQENIQLLRRPESVEGIAASALPGDVWGPGSDVPPDRWVFGQFNRMLPAKVSCRGLANLLIGNRKALDVEDAGRLISHVALHMGELLRRYDEETGTDRDNSLGVAFPKAGDTLPKSLLRYATQFVCSVSSSGQLSGLPYALKFLNTAGVRGQMVGLTEPGLAFAQMWNPVLDGAEDTWKKRFSDDEVIFLLEHIAQWVPAEASAYLTLGRLVLEGFNAPSAIDGALTEIVRKSTSSPPSESFVSSQRSGAISRMTDLGLITRIREGATVQYEVTDAGRRYIERLGTAN